MSKLRNRIETDSEHIPSEEQVHTVFKELIGQEYTVVKKREDQKGLYMLEVEVPGESERETTEYSYTRKDRYKETRSTATEINVIYFEDGVPVHGTTSAKYIDGEWKIIK